jgi:hypothetical protein
MASAAVSSFLLPHPATLCPPPLQLQKKIRRTTIHKRTLRKSTQSQFQFAQGPLDDIIANINGDIQESPIDYTTNFSIFDWSNPLKAPSTWAVTPLPVSRAPSDQPLTIRKNRNSRSSTSGSSKGNSMSASRKTSHDTTPWPSLNTTLSHESAGVAKPSNTAPRTDHANAQPNPDSPAKHVDSHAGPTTQRRTSRLRLFTNGFPRLRRIGTGEASASTDEASESASPTGTTARRAGTEEASNCQDICELGDEAVNAHTRKNTHK